MSDEMKHTPGPWRAQTFAALDGHEVVSDSWDVVSGSLVSAAPIRKLSDTRLIAAAPDMLRALRKAVLALAHADDQSHGLYAEAYETVTFAIAKATGGNHA